MHSSILAVELGCQQSHISQTWIQDLLIQDQDPRPRLAYPRPRPRPKPRLWRPRPRPRLKTYLQDQYWKSVTGMDC